MQHQGGAGIWGRVGFGSLSAPTDAQGAHAIGEVEDSLELMKHPTPSICDQPAPAPGRHQCCAFFLGAGTSCPASAPIQPGHALGTSWPAASQTSTLLQPFPGPGIMKESKIIFVLAELH